MGEVIRVARWKRDGEDEVLQKLLSCDRFIRSRFIPPPMGNVVFNFRHGKVTVCTICTVISGDDCEIIIRAGEAQLVGSIEDATALFCSIHREIENLNPHATKSA